MIGEICGVNSSCGVHKGKVCKVGGKRARFKKGKGKVEGWVVGLKGEKGEKKREKKGC
jgi:hypothetical protein